jgi:hypothetical protein
MHSGRMRLGLTCAFCGSPFYTYEGTQRCCSIHCRDALRRTQFETFFWERVKVVGDCWEWQRKCDIGGYARIQRDGRNSQRVMVHRFAWELVRGPIPEGLCVLHHCDNRKCVRVSLDDTQSHLFLGTVLDNARDMFEKGRENKARGERHGNARLTEKDVRLIRKLASEGVSQKELAERYGVHYVYLNKLVRGHKWSHVV